MPGGPGLGGKCAFGICIPPPTFPPPHDMYVDVAYSGAALNSMCTDAGFSPSPEVCDLRGGTAYVPQRNDMSSGIKPVCLAIPL